VKSLFGAGPSSGLQFEYAISRQRRVKAMVYANLWAPAQPLVLLLAFTMACDNVAPAGDATPADGNLTDGSPGDGSPGDGSPADGSPADGNPADGNGIARDYTVGVFYYPWYGANNFHGREYLRGELTPPQLPTLGEYDDTDGAVISQHLAWSGQAGINLWVASWWGPDSRTDRTLKNVIMPHNDLAGVKIALFYETTGRIGPDDDINNAYTDIDYAAKTYFGNTNYLRIDGRPVVAVYVTRSLDEARLTAAVNNMRRAASDNGYNLYIIGDQVFGNPPTRHPYSPFDLLDAVTNYDVYGSMGRPRYAKQSGVELRRTRQNQWRDLAHQQNCAFIPSVAPGYNDRGVRLESNHPGLSRRLDEGEPQGSLFQATLANALDLVDDSTGKMLLINSWNEWHEDTQIEPVGTGESTTNPAELTQGLDYHVYGELYLNILRAALRGETLELPQ
jgi:hypothetical protein